MSKFSISFILVGYIMACIFGQEQKNGKNNYSFIEISPYTEINEFDEMDFHNADDKFNESCLINAGTIIIGETTVKDGITFIYAEENDKIIYIKTIDENFKTAEGLSIKSSLKDFFKVYGQDFQFEVGTCMYLELSDGWKACLSYDYTIDFSGHILYFYKIDEDYSSHMSLVDYLDFMQY